MSVEPVTRFQKFLRVLADSSAYMPEPLRDVEKVCCYACGHLDSYPAANTRLEKLIASVRDKSIVPPAPVTRLEKYVAAMAGYYTDELPEPLTAEEKILYDVASGEDVTLEGNPLVLANCVGRPLKECVVSWEPEQEGEGTPYPAGGGKNLADNSLLQNNLGVSTDGRLETAPDGRVAINGDINVSGIDTVTLSCGGTAAFIYALFDGNTLIKREASKPNKSTIDVSGGNILRVCVYSGVTIADIKYIQVEAGSTATAYAPYANIRPIHGRTAVSVERCGENLLDLTNKAEAKNVTVVGDKIHIVDTSGWGQSYIIFASNFPNGSYTMSFSSNVAGKGRVIIRTYDKNGISSRALVEIKDSRYYSSWNTYYNGFIIVSNLPPSMQKISFTVDKAAYFNVGFAGGLTTETEAELLEVQLVPGTTAPATYSPYSGSTTTLTLPSTIYGGEVGADGAGQETWKLLTLTGEEQWAYESNSYFVGHYTLTNPPVETDGKCSHFVYHYNYGGDCIFCIGDSVYTGPQLTAKYTNVDEWKSYLAAQYAAGTPVQIAYKLATPQPFTATGGGTIPAVKGTNTLLSDADTIKATYRCNVKAAAEEIDTLYTDLLKEVEE